MKLRPLLFILILTLVIGLTACKKDDPPVIYTVSFDTQGAPPLDNVDIEAGKTIELPTLTKEGYTFLGWYLDTAYETPFSRDTPVEDNLVLYARFSINTYTMTFINGDEEITENIDYDATIAYPILEREGYTFSGWYDDSSYDNTYTAERMPASDVTLYAKWEINTYRIDLMPNNDENPLILELDYLEEIDLPEIERTGHAFLGWFADAEFMTPFELESMPANNLVLYADWNRLSYSVQFEMGLAPSIDPIQIPYGTELDVAVPEVYGYEFAGWFLDPSFTDPFTQNTMPAEDLLLYAQYTVIAFSINYNTNGGNAIPNDTYDYGADINVLPTPTRTGHRFIGWYEDPDLHTPFAIETMPGENLTAYAKWSINLYRIEFDTNGGEAIAPVRQLYGTTLPPLEPTKEGQVFAGWYLDPLFTEPFEYRTMPGEDTLLFAKWHSILSFNSNGGSGLDSISAMTDEKIIMPDDPVRLGYTFNGWYLDQDFSIPFDSVQMPDISTVLHAKWDINNYSLSFEPNGGTTVEPLIFDYQSPIENLDIPEFEGHTFVGWYLDSEFAHEFNLNHMPAYDIVLYAQWQTNTYTLSFDTQGGEPLDSLSVSYLDPIPDSLPTPAKNGFTFVEWFLDDELKTSFDYSIMPSHNIVLYASYTINSYEISFYSFDQSIIETIPLDYLETIPLPTPPEEIGFTFSGWYIDEHLTLPFDHQVMPAHDLSVYASYEINTYALSFESNGGTPIADIRYEYEQHIDALPVSEKIGHTFAGWFTDTLLTVGFDYVQMPAEDIILYAKYEINTYQIDFETNSDHVTEPRSYPFEAVVSDLPEPTKVGHSFVAWYVDPTFEEPFEQTVMPPYDLVLYALWDINMYTIEYVTNVEHDLDEEHIAYGDAIGLLQDPFDDQLTFAGWFTDESLTTPFDLEVMPANNLTVYARWISTVSFDTMGSEELPDLLVEINDSISVPDDPILEGHTFITWSLSLESKDPYDFDQPITRNLTIYAIFDPNEYVISFETLGGTHVRTIIADFGTIIEPDTTTKTGYDFLGWYAHPEAEDPYPVETMPAENIVLYAKWEKADYVISFETLTDALVDDMTVSFTDPIPDLETPEVVGLTFSGWYFDVEYEMAMNIDHMPAYDFTLYAKWEVNEYLVSYDTTGGSSIDPMSVAYGAPIPFPDPPIKDGYIFTRWFEDSSLETEFTDDTMPARDFTLFAEWRDTFTITFDSRGGSPVNPISQRFDTLIQMPELPWYTGHTFIGWFIDLDDSTPFTFDLMPTYDLELFAKWEVNIHELTLMRGDTVYDSMEIAHNAYISLPTPTFDGYVFTSWSYDVSGNEIFDSEVMPNEDLTLYGQWTPLDFTIDIVSDGPLIFDPVTITYGEVIELPDPTVSGYAFTGWFTDSEFTELLEYDVMPAINFSLYPHWEKQSYTFVLISDGEPIFEEITLYETPLMLVPEDLEGHTFDQWYLDPELTESNTFDTMPAHDLTLYASWIPNDYHITFSMGSANAIEPLTITYQDEIVLPEGELFGYDFADWYLDEALTVAFDLLIMPAYDITLYPKFIAHQFTVDYYEEVEIESAASGHNFTLVLTDDNRIYSFGRNHYGQLGNGTTTDSSTPIDITSHFALSENERIEKVVSGVHHSGVLTSDHRVFTWGSNIYGQLGNGASASSSIPVDVTTSFNLESDEYVVDLLSGYHHMVALTSHHRVFTWGNNQQYELGDGTTSIHNTPQDITPHFDFDDSVWITQLISSTHHTFVRSSENLIYGWGNNDYGQLGSTSFGSQSTPIEIDPHMLLLFQETILDIQAGLNHTIILTSSHRVLTVGYNGFGQIGNGVLLNQDYPIDISYHFDLAYDEKVERIFAAENQNMLITSSNRVFVIGDNRQGQLADSAKTSILNPKDVTSGFVLSDIEVFDDIHMGINHTVITTSSSRMFTFGNNGFGQLGRHDDALISSPKLFTLKTSIHYGYESYLDHPTPIKEGFLFDRWYSDPDFTVPADTHMPYENLSLYASMLPIQND